MAKTQKQTEEAKGKAAQEEAQDDCFGTAYDPKAPECGKCKDKLPCAEKMKGEEKPKASKKAEKADPPEAPKEEKAPKATKKAEEKPKEEAKPSKKAPAKAAKEEVKEEKATKKAEEKPKEEVNKFLPNTSLEEEKVTKGERKLMALFESNPATSSLELVPRRDKATPRYLRIKGEGVTGAMVFNAKEGDVKLIVNWKAVWSGNPSELPQVVEKHFGLGKKASKAKEEAKPTKKAEEKATKTAKAKK